MLTEYLSTPLKYILYEKQEIFKIIILLFNTKTKIK